MEKDENNITLRSRELKVELNSSTYPKNVRLAIAETMIELSDSFLKKESDDTKTFIHICHVSIYILYTIDKYCIGIYFVIFLL